MTLLTWSKRLYARMPAEVRSVAASTYGYYLRSWRYGPETTRLIEEAFERESWSPEEWSTWRSPRLTALLDYAATRVPYYREYWQRERPSATAQDWRELANWPILEKEPVRRDPRSFLGDGLTPSRLFQVSTSGTTGTPIVTWRSKESTRAYYALFEARKRGWYGVGRRARWAIIGSQRVVPPQQTQPPFWVWNAGLRQLYLSSFHVAPRNVAAYLSAMSRHRVQYLLGYPSSIYAIARMAQSQGLGAPKLLVVVSNAEELLPHQRSLISKVFACPVRNTYGMAENVAAANECEYGTMHMWPEAGITEVVGDADEALPSGATGHLICTGLLNPDMPLIRYRIGDRAALAARGGDRCECGRTLPAMERIDGRSTQNIVTADGRRIFGFTAVFEGLPIMERQLIQHGVQQFEILIVPDDQYDDTTTDLIRSRLEALVGSVQVDVRMVSTIPRGQNGKFNSVISHVTDADVSATTQARSATA